MAMCTTAAIVPGLLSASMGSAQGAAPSSMTYATIPVEYCRDKEFVARRLQRLSRGVPPFEIENFKKACGVP